MSIVKHESEQERTCPICDYPHARLRYRMKDRFFGVTSEQFELFRCSSCGLLFLPEEGVKERLEEFYPRGYWWNSSGGLSRLEAAYREWVVRHDQLAFLLSLVDGAAPRLLDIGCGSGLLVRLAREAGLEAWGLEPSREAVEIARQSLPGCVIEGSVAEAIKLGGKFDVLSLFHALEHMPEPFRYLKEIQKLLRRPGSLVIQVPNAASWQARIFGPRWYGLDCPRHLYNYTPFALLHLLGRAGYRIQRVRHFSLRDNAAALASSAFPWLDPMSGRVRLLRRGKRPASARLLLGEALYLPALLAAQPLAWLEAFVGRGATITVHATLE